MPPLGAVVDAFLYLGRCSHEILPGADVYLSDPAYLAETALDRDSLAMCMARKVCSEDGSARAEAPMVPGGSAMANKWQTSSLPRPPWIL